ncbi:MAG: hypothetical protein H0A75_06025 [Candidatus Methanofishera endochildressiae]|uniref:Uncharacterized protein n=1 Tax=Candidatus Methanofishera endochildressiae TaxID=2738884 RepID=A0A7Z0MNZ2_9GAMM|nr:hypothetical protein [Candidatus Methanofishera endochildressiae]
MPLFAKVRMYQILLRTLLAIRSVPLRIGYFCIRCQRAGIERSISPV